MKSPLSTIVSFFKKREKLFFALVAVANLLPIFSGKYFASLDGPAHLYNSQIINTLLFDQSSLSDFFILNNIVVPNWIGHFVLSSLSTILPLFIAEKILVLIYCLGLPFLFRGIIKLINPNNLYLSYLIFPFIYSFTFMLGFYNFSIAIVLLMYLGVFLLRNKKKLSSKGWIQLSVLLLLIYFSHLLIFVLALGITALHTWFGEKFQWRGFLKKNINLLICSITPIYLLIQYTVSQSGPRNYTFQENEALLDNLLRIRPIIFQNIGIESRYTYILFAIIGLIFGFAIYQFVRTKLKLNKTSLFLLVTTVSLLIFYFTLPDSDGRAGYLTTRLGWCFFISLILWTSTQKIPKAIQALALTVSILCAFSLGLYYAKGQRKFSEIRNQCFEAGEKVKANSTVLPLNFHFRWQTPHYSNYLGVHKPVVILENYECGTGYFPVKWNYQEMPNLKLGSYSSGEIQGVKWPHQARNSPKLIDYVFIMGTEEDLKQKIDVINAVSEDYTITYKNKDCVLYKLKSKAH